MNYFKDISPQTKHKFLIEMKKYEKILNSLGYIMTIAYGTMLGAIREQKFIDHDNDIDLAIIMKGNNIEQIRQEKNYIIKHLIKFKYTMKKNNASQFKPISPDCGLCLDTFTIYFNDQNQAYFYPYNGCFSKSDILPLITVKLYDFSFFTLRNYTKIFTILYNDWKSPITKEKMLDNKIHKGSITDLNQIKWKK